MSRNVASLSLALALAIAAACSSTPQRGPMQNAGATAGRVIDDSVITAKVKSELIADPVTKAYQINVETYDGTVQLSGFVDNAAERERAVKVAKGVEGVRAVKNDMALRKGR